VNVADRSAIVVILFGEPGADEVERKLSYGDSFSYALARRVGRPLLFVGEDFSRTDVAVGGTRIPAPAMVPGRLRVAGSGP
jgi:uncharacterized protein with PIN domain